MRPLRNVGRDVEVAELATRQHGVVSIAQLQALGWTTSAISGRQRAGKLHRLHRGVYAVGHAVLTRRGRWAAAVLACGPQAFLSHRSAAELHGIRDHSPWFAEVTSPLRHRRRRGIVTHTATDLEPVDTTIADGIPCASVALALLGVAEMDPSSLGAAVAAAERRRLLGMREVDSLLGRSPGRPGTTALRDALARIRSEEEWTRSELERRFLHLCADAGFPRPKVNAWIALPDGGLEVDFSWPQPRVVVEVDGYGWHGDRAAFEEDRRRDQLLAAAGWRVVRFTWRQVVREPRVVAEILRRVLVETHVRGDVAR
jgi:Transcriptional regulator, AbiEi antitoxin/Protein of unknown function (DUF559)